MKTVRELADMAIADAPAAEPAPPLRLDVRGSTAIAPVVRYLAEYFGADVRRRVVELVVDGTLQGFLPREILYALLQSSSKGAGFGAGAGARLPGRSQYTIVTLACPHPGCDRRVATIYFDPAAPPRCPQHPSVAMQRTPPAP